jgi:hypothetical protein
MPFDGSGNYTPASAPNFPAVGGTTIQSSYYNAVINDIASAFNNCLTRDGQGKPSAAINWNNQNLTAVSSFAATTGAFSGNVTIGGTLSVTGTVAFTAAITVPDEAYGVAWNNNLQVPTKNAVYDEMELRAPKANPIFTGTASFVTATFSGVTTFSGLATFSVGLTANQVIINAAAGTERNLLFQSSGVTVASIGLGTDNVTVRYNTPTEHQFDIGGTEKVTITSTGLNVTDGASAAINLIKTGADAGTATITNVGSLVIVSGGASFNNIYRANAHDFYSNSGGTLYGFINTSGWNGGAILSGTPTTPTAAAQTNNTQIASTAFVQQERAPRKQTAGANSITPTFANDIVERLACDGAVTLNNPTGTAIDGHGIVVRLRDNGTARAIAYGAQYRAVGVTLPTTTTIGKLVYIGMIYNLTDTKWDIVAVGQEA